MKKIFKTILAGTSAVAMATPLVAIASCSKTTGVDDATTVYTPSFRKLAEETTGKKASAGLKQYLEFLTEHPQAPVEEYRWMTSLVGATLAQYAKQLNDQWKESNAGYININTLGSKMSNFSTKKSADGDTLASYDVKIATDIDFSVDILKLIDQNSNEQELSAIIAGHLKPNLAFSVKNIPLSTFVLEVPYLDAILGATNEGEIEYPNHYWLISPDLSGVDLITNTEYGFAISGNLDVRLDFNSQNLINFNNGLDITLDSSHHELFTYIKEMLPEYLSGPTTAILKKFLTMPCGWLSYAMSDIAHIIPVTVADEVTYGWNKGSRDYCRKEEGYSYTPFTIPVSATSPAQFTFTLKDDPFMYEDESGEKTPIVLSKMIGQGGNINGLIPQSIEDDKDAGLIFDYVYPEDNIGTIAYDMAQGVNENRRPLNGTYASIYDSCKQYRNLILGDGWLYVTQPVDFVEWSDLTQLNGAALETETLNYSEKSSGVLVESEGQKYSIYTNTIQLSKTMYEYLDENRDYIKFYASALSDPGREGTVTEEHPSNVLGVSFLPVGPDGEQYLLSQETTTDETTGEPVTKYYLDVPLLLSWNIGESAGSYTYPFELYCKYYLSKDINPVWGLDEEELTKPYSWYDQILGRFAVQQGEEMDPICAEFDQEEPEEPGESAPVWTTFATLNPLETLRFRISAPKLTKGLTLIAVNATDSTKQHPINFVDGCVKAVAYNNDGTIEPLYVDVYNETITISHMDGTTYTINQNSTLEIYMTIGYNEISLKNARIDIMTDWITE